jgi:hypothetical protein
VVQLRLKRQQGGGVYNSDFEGIPVKGIRVTAIMFVKGFLRVFPPRYFYVLRHILFRRSFIVYYLRNFHVLILLPFLINGFSVFLSLRLLEVTVIPLLVYAFMLFIPTILLTLLTLSYFITIINIELCIKKSGLCFCFVISFTNCFQTRWFRLFTFWIDEPELGDLREQHAMMCLQGYSQQTIVWEMVRQIIKLLFHNGKLLFYNGVDLAVYMLMPFR